MVVEGVTEVGVADADEAAVSPASTRSRWKHYPPVHTPLALAPIARAVVQSIADGANATLRLEAYLRERYHADTVHLHGSGTQALTAAIAASLGATGSRGVVALPAYNCYDVASAAVGADAGIVLYDIDPDTLSPAWDSFDAALAAGAAAAVVAPLHGFPIDWERAEAIAARHGTIVIEDAAQGIGASWRGRPLGSLGQISVLSFGRGKGWTGGGGGAVLLRGTRISLAQLRPATRSAGARTALLATAQWLLSSPRLFALPASIPWLHLGQTVYKPPAEVRRMTAYSAALLLATADIALRESETRRRIGMETEHHVADMRGLQSPRTVSGGTPGYLRFPARVSSAGARAALLHEFRRDGVAAGYPDTMAGVSAIRDRVINHADRFEGAAALVRELVTFPTHAASARITLDRLAANRS